MAVVPVKTTALPAAAAVAPPDEVIINQGGKTRRANVFLLGAGIGPAIDHGALLGLLDDDHPQYFTEGRADAWLAPQAADYARTNVPNVFYSNTVNHGFILDHPSDDQENANVFFVWHKAVYGASAMRCLNAVRHERGAFGYINPFQEGVPEFSNPFAGYMYFDSCDIDGGLAVGKRLTISGYYRSAYAVHLTMETESATLNTSFHMPLNDGTWRGPHQLLLSNRGSVAVGLSPLAAAASHGFLLLPQLPGPPTGTAWTPDNSWAAVAFEGGAKKIWAYVPDPTLTLPDPSLYFPFDESSGSPGDEMYYGAGFWWLSVPPPGFAGSGKYGGQSRRFARASADYLTLVEHYSRVHPAATFLWSLWIRPLISFGYSGRIFNANGVLNLFLTPAGQVLADFATGAVVVGPSADTQLAIGTWSHILVWRDDVAKTFHLQVDGGVVQTASYGFVPPVTPVVPYVGWDGVFTQYLDADLDEWALFNGTCLDAALRAALYDGGAGRFYRFASGWTGANGAWVSTPALT